MSTAYIEHVIRGVLIAADWQDGIALRSQVKFYRYGVAGALPDEWKKYATYAGPHPDHPEWDRDWVEYQRLREKFEGKSA